MPKLSLGQKVNRTVTFLLGLRDKHIASRLAEYGFSQEDLDEGWELVRKAAGPKLMISPLRLSNPNDLRLLDEWENLWFPVAQATLQRHHKDVNAWMFLNLSQAQGEEVIFTVSTFVQRFDALTSSDGPTAGPAAKELLVKRGFTSEVIQEAATLLAKLKQIEPAEAEKPISDEEFAIAESNMWAYYLEWSAIAHIAIKNSRLLKKLGFLKRRSKKTEVEEEVWEAPEEPPTV